MRSGFSSGWGLWLEGQVFLCVVPCCSSGMNYQLHYPFVGGGMLQASVVSDLPMILSSSSIWSLTRWPARREKNFPEP
ncbi:hypothetical protein [Rubritalea tangerina]|uniref:hypothetical protein n=1 Tax=Rubritalea tangerina TaxID=430798 RepID=UPI003611906C